jgi:hypothetical protein
LKKHQKKFGSKKKKALSLQSFFRSEKKSRKSEQKAARNIFAIERTSGNKKRSL